MEQARKKRQVMSVELRNVNYRYESMDKQKWIKVEDSNSKFFHSIVNWKSVNEIKSLVSQREWVEKPTLVKEKIRIFFITRFEENGNINLSLQYLQAIIEC